MPEEVFETPQIVESRTTNWPKIILVAVLGFGLLAASAYSGYWYGTESAKIKTKISELELETQNQVSPTLETTTPPTPTSACEQEPDVSTLASQLTGEVPEQIAETLFTQYLDRYKSRRSCTVAAWLEDYKITQIMFYRQDGNIFRFGITYSVKQMYPQEHYWEVGNGVMGEDGWVDDKYAFVAVEKEGTIYRIRGMGTGGH